MIARGRGRLGEWAIEIEAGHLTVSGPNRADLRLPVGSGPGQVSTATLVTTPVWPAWWLGWGPARCCDLALVDSVGEPLALLPAGGGWVETARIARRYAYPFYPRREHLPRLVPGWSRSEIGTALADSGIAITERENKTGRRIVLSLSDAQSTWS